MVIKKEKQDRKKIFQIKNVEQKKKGN